jgi:hypothetical protein
MDEHMQIKFGLGSTAKPPVALNQWFAILEEDMQLQPSDQLINTVHLTTGHVLRRREACS